MKPINKLNKIILTAILCLIVFCFISVLLNIFSIDQLPSSFVGAVFGALITVVVTAVLLKSQSQSEEEIKRNVNVFEKKSPIFQDFINKLWVIWSDHIVTSKEYEKLVEMYYSNLLIYLPNEESSDKINKCLVNIGNFIDKKTFGGEYRELRSYIIEIINLLSEEINLGGQIDTRKVDELDKQIFPVLFKRKLINAFNVTLNTNDSFLNKGEWQEWKEHKNITHECMSFSLKNYSGISIKFCLGEKMEPFLIVPHGAKYHKFDEFRAKGAISQRIIIDPKKGWIDLFQSDDDYDEILPFNFKEGKNLDKVSEENYHEIISILAERGAKYVSETKIKIHDGEKSIIDFLECIYA